VKRRFQGLSDASRSGTDELSDGIFLVRIELAHYRWHAQNPFYLVRFSILEPRQLASRSITGRIYCTPKALWKLSWFLRDFGYDADLLGHDEIEDRQLVGLAGVLKISHVVRNGTSLLNLDAFAPAGEWDRLSLGTTSQPPSLAEVAS
jgi:hypothetical protein